VEPLTRGLPPPDLRSLCPLPSTEFVEPPQPKNSGYATAHMHVTWCSVMPLKNQNICTIFECLPTAAKKIAILQDVTQCSRVDVYRRFRETWCLIVSVEGRLYDGDSGFLRKWRLSSRTRLHGVISQMTGMLICTELVSVDACACTREVIYGFVCRGIRNCD
jgi:hypothetical protein